MPRKLSLVTALAFLCSIGFALAQTDKPQQMSAEQKAAMEAWQKFMTPGDAHKVLDSTVGTFDTKITTWMTPGATPMVSTGTSQNQWVLGNRYVEEHFTGNFMGQPFEGIGYTGYDNGKKQYFATWIDNMGTGLMVSTGNTADKGKNWKYATVATDPMTGKDTPGEVHVTMPDADHHTMEMWGAGPDGKIYKMMQIEYTRRK